MKFGRLLVFVFLFLQGMGQCFLQGSKHHMLLIEGILQSCLKLCLGCLLLSQVCLSLVPLLGQPCYLPLLLPKFLLLLPLTVH